VAEILVDLERVTARRPDRPLFESLSLTVSTGDRLGVVEQHRDCVLAVLGVAEVRDRDDCALLLAD